MGSCVEDVLELARNGATPSEIFNETGLVVMANGNIADGIGGEVIWRRKNGQSGSLSANSTAWESGQSAQTEVSNNDGRRTETSLAHHLGWDVRTTMHYGGWSNYKTIDDFRIELDTDDLERDAEKMRKFYATKVR